MIELQGVSFSYDGDSAILSDAGAAIGEGLTLVVGPNGCGKSTLMKLMAGVERPDRGIIRIDGRDLWRDEAAARARLAYLPEHPDLPPYVTLAEALSLVCRLRGVGVAAAREGLRQAGLGHVAGRSVRELSLGQRRRALFAAARIGDCGTLLLDEPLEAMDQVIRAEILAWLAGRLERGATAVVVTHQTAPFLPMAGRVMTTRGGALAIFDLPPGEDPEREALVGRLARGDAA